MNKRKCMNNNIRIIRFANIQQNSWIRWQRSPSSWPPSRLCSFAACFLAFTCSYSWGSCCSSFCFAAPPIMLWRILNWKGAREGPLLSAPSSCVPAWRAAPPHPLFHSKDEYSHWSFPNGLSRFGFLSSKQRFLSLVFRCGFWALLFFTEALSLLRWGRGS